MATITRQERVASLIVLCICLIISTIGAGCFGVASGTHAGAVAAVFIALACLCCAVAFGCIFLVVCWVVLFADTHRHNRQSKQNAQGRQQ